MQNLDYLENRNGILYVEGCSITELVKKFDTPLYVYSENRIRENYRRLFNAFKKRYDKFRLHYAIKANSNLAVLKILREEGARVDCSNINEIKTAKLVGFSSDQISYTGNYHSDNDLNTALEENVVINLDDISQFDRLIKFKVPELISFRVNPEIGKAKFDVLVLGKKESKFGISQTQIVEAYEKARNFGVKRFGIHMMAGSCVLDENYFEELTEKLMNIVGNISKSLNIQFEFINIGGGFGIPYEPNEKELDIEKVAEKVVEKFKQKLQEYALGEPWLLIEPGRYIIGDASILLSKVNSIKTGYKKFIGLDASMSTLIRPALYGAYHQIYNAVRLNETETEVVDVCGAICENTDIFAKDRTLVKTKEGDILAFLNAGAYGFIMSSQYHNTLKPAEILVNGNKAELIRERESFNDLVSKQKIPHRLIG